MIYLDNAATTRVFDSVVKEMERYYSEEYFNPSALYSPAFEVVKKIAAARAYLCDKLGGGGKLYFTSCATESNAWVYNCGVKNKKGNILVSMGEHASGYENARALADKGFDVRFVKLCADGTVDISDYQSKLDENTTLASVIHCSNETGAINDIARLSRIAKQISPRCLFHSDGVQAFCKIDVNCEHAGIDLYSLSAHKIGGPKGIGALWVRDGIRIAPFIIGGGQEEGERSGTENVAAIMGFCQAAKDFSAVDGGQMFALRQRMKKALEDIKDAVFNEANEQSPYILSLSIAGIKAEVLQRKLADKGILIGLGSACSSRLKKNRVLSAMGRDMRQIEGNVRIGFGVCNLSDDMDSVAKTIKECVEELRWKK